MILFLNLDFTWIKSSLSLSELIHVVFLGKASGQFEVCLQDIYLTLYLFWIKLIILIDPTDEFPLACANAPI